MCWLFSEVGKNSGESSFQGGKIIGKRELFSAGDPRAPKGEPRRPKGGPGRPPKLQKPPKMETKGRQKRGKTTILGAKARGRGWAKPLDISATVPRELLVCLGSKQQCLSSMLNLDPDLDGSKCSGLSFKGISPPLPMLLAAPLPPRFCNHFSIQLFGSRFLPNSAPK